MDQTPLIEPSSYIDFYTKTSLAQFILKKSPSTFTKMEKEGKLFAPRFVRNNFSLSDNPRKYYSMADAMRISIILHGFIDMERIYQLGLSVISDANLTDTYLLLSSNSHAVNLIKKDIRNSLNIIKQQIVEGIKFPVDLSPYLMEENFSNELQH